MSILSDKLRNSYPIAVDFVDGELPTSNKMSALGRQSKFGQNLIQHAIGDVWNQSGDPVINSISIHENALMIPNLARYIGSTRNTSPYIPALPNIEKYTYAFADDVTDYAPHAAHEATLDFPVESLSTSFAWAGATAPTGSPQPGKDYVNATGKWYVNRETGNCFFYDTIASDWKLTYEPVVDGDIDSDATFNIIPDPDTLSSYDFQGVKIEYFNNIDNSQGYKIYLPPRGPLNTRQLRRSPQTTDNYGTAIGDKKFWLDDGETAPDTGVFAEHYRYNVPKILSNNWSANDVIPTGLVFLWDQLNTGTVIDGVTLRAENAGTPKTWMFIASGTRLDGWLSTYDTIYSDAMLQSSSHDAAYYPSDGLRVITVGQDVSRSIAKMIQHLYDHDHSSSYSMPSNQIDHRALKSLFYTQNLGGGYPKLDASAMAIGDDHPQYLHRWNFSDGATYTRDKYHNAMLGDLIISSTDPTDNYLNTADDSYKLYFGKDESDGAYIYLNTNGTTGRVTVHYSPTAPNSGGFRVGDGSQYLDLILTEGSGFVSTSNMLRSTHPLTIQSKDLSSSYYTWTISDSLSDSTVYSHNPQGFNNRIEHGDNAIFQLGPEEAVTGTVAQHGVRLSKDAVFSATPTWSWHYTEIGRLDGAVDPAMTIAQAAEIESPPSVFSYVGDGAAYVHLPNDGSTYQQGEIEKDIIVPLHGGGTAYDDSDVQKVFVKKVDRWWQPAALNADCYLQCESSDWPEGCTINSITVYWKVPLVDRVKFQAWKAVISDGEINPLITEELTSEYSAAANGTWHSISIPTLSPIDEGWAHESDILLVRFINEGVISPAQQEDCYIRPWIKLNVTYNSVCKWNTGLHPL